MKLSKNHNTIGSNVRAKSKFGEEKTQKNIITISE